MKALNAQVIEPFPQSIEIKTETGQMAVNIVWENPLSTKYE
ncbi:MAG TPA: hypothetical protein VI731_09210 [Bacteroidia bacterium]|nr:hypothetical protein [Bacteroidia bacterium]